VALVLGLAMAAVGTVTGPPLARAAAAADTAELRRIAVTSARGLAAPAALALPGVALAGAPVLAWLGTGFAAAAPALVALWIGQLANLACGPVAVLLTCHERERAVLAGVALGAAANVGLNALLIPPLGATGAAIATAASTALWNVVLVVAVRRRIGVDPTVLGRRTRAVAA
jgi:O-antigen/teichoic acid export membrane protein